MVKKKTIGISLISIVIIALGITVGPSFFETPQYYCESESSILECPGGLSGGSGTRCYLNEEKTSWDYCSGGWALITDDTPIQETPASNQGDKCWKCAPEGCNPCEVI